jgi:hypothetical protein
MALRGASVSFPGPCAVRALLGERAMADASQWLPLLVVIVSFVAAAVVRRLRTRHRLQRRTVLCPHELRHADCVVRLEERSGRATGVVRCNVLQDPSRVDCDQSCLRQLDRSR